MKMTPIDIQQHQFRVKFRGFDVQEVDTYLDQMADAFGALLDEQERRKDEIEKLRAELQVLKDREETFKRVMLASQKTIETMKENARKTAEVTIAEAEVKAEKILNKAHTRLAQLHADLAELKRQRMQIDIQIRSVLDAHARLLDMGQEEAKAIEEEESKLMFLQK